MSSSERKQEREEFLAELFPLKEFGLTDYEIEAIMEQCGLKPRKFRILDTSRRLEQIANDAE